MKMLNRNLMILVALAAGEVAVAAGSTAPLAAPDLVLDEVDGIVAVEAEHFYKQTLTDKRAWHITSSKSAPDIKPDVDPPHVAGASGGAYLEILPDTRAEHGDKLVKGENFTDEPGQMAVLHYNVHINTPGRYYVWLRAFSTGSEDNGVHVGLNGQWPESGRRWQTMQKDRWTWDCRQRTQKVHAGVPMQLFLDIAKAGEHEIQFSMREDGFEMDKFVLAHDKEYRPEDQGPAMKVKSGRMPEPFPEVAEAAPSPKQFPTHWGTPPEMQTMDYRPLPGGYGHGSSTMADWIQQNLDKDASRKSGSPARSAGPSLVLPRKADGKGTVEINGDLKEWHKVTLTIDGPYAHERDNEPNPFTDFNLTVTFTHESGAPGYKVPGYFAVLCFWGTGGWANDVSVIEGVAYPDNAAAQATWKPMVATAPVSVAYRNEAIRVLAENGFNAVFPNMLWAGSADC